jgi:toxin ParE1/3/4
MARRVKFTRQAEDDLIALISFIAYDSPERARVFLARIEERCRILALWPKSGRPRPEIAGELRSFPVSPLVVFYRVVPPESGDVEIVRVIDGRRDLGTVFFE